jgi:dTDP-glucose pyrophosphorylase
MLEIVVPMAGRGSRFATVGYPQPKPLIPVKGVPMIQLVIANLTPSRPHQFTFICQREHLDRYDLADHLTDWAPGCRVVGIDRVTEGAACTVLLARDQIASDRPLMIANCDQYIDADIDEYLGKMESERLDGLIMTMTADHPKWSYVGFDADGRVSRVVEKEVISDQATVGIYNFARGNDFVRAAERMIDRDLRVNGEFYVAPTYNQLIEDGAKIGVYDIGSVGAGMYGLGVPEDLIAFEGLPVADRAARRVAA